MPLTLTRQPGETVVIGDNVRVTIYEVRGDKVRLKIEAPRDVRVDRLEVYAAIQRGEVKP